jgi:hypothetical protein
MTWPQKEIYEFMHMAYQVDEETMSGLNDDRSLYDPACVKSTLSPVEQINPFNHKLNGLPF